VEVLEIFPSAPTRLRLVGDPQVDTFQITAQASSTSAAGSIMLSSDQLVVRDRGRVSVSNSGVGDAGNLELQSNEILLDAGRLTAQVNGGNRGNINILANQLGMRHGSQITTNARGQASGGNINLNTDLILGLENSDIVARAEQGTGGRIAIDIQGLIGIKPRSELTDDSDINASS
jgi:large exoprotein involved in heme utilization and adhesion